MSVWVGRARAIRSVPWRDRALFMPIEGGETAGNSLLGSNGIDVGLQCAPAGG
ncbi:hypothetical protein U879_07735 [Defluviimonas sp. 20V17]|nr:hypothetical protein U879_07735 [Defluviimonas sp. 20V17]